MNTAGYIAGLDLGKKQDFTGLVIVEKSYQPDLLRTGQNEPHFAVRHIHRWPLLTPYPEIVADLKVMFTQPELKNAPLVVDGTGVGVAVVDLLTMAQIATCVQPVTITGGESETTSSVAKKNLVGSVQVALESRRLKIAAGLELAETLARELELFRVKVTTARNEVFESWRERDHDDLVLALALAVWFGSRPAMIPTLILPTQERAGFPLFR